MNNKLWHLLTIIDNKVYIDLHVCKVYENGLSKCLFEYNNLHKKI